MTNKPTFNTITVLPLSETLGYSMNALIRGEREVGSSRLNVFSGRGNNELVFHPTATGSEQAAEVRMQRTAGAGVNEDEARA